MDALFLFLEPLVQSLAGKYGVIVTIIAWMGTLRLLVPPMMKIAKVITAATPSPKDDEVIVKIETSKAYKIVLDVLEWLTSIDLSKVEVKKVEEPKTEG